MPGKRGVIDTWLVDKAVAAKPKAGDKPKVDVEAALRHGNVFD